MAMTWFISFFSQLRKLRFHVNELLEPNRDHSESSVVQFSKTVNYVETLENGEVGGVTVAWSLL